MGRPLVLIHGYSATGLDFHPLRKALEARGIDAADINIANYVSLSNEITIKDIAEGLDRAFRYHPKLKDGQDFDAIVHSTGMLVIRSWLTNYGGALRDNCRLKRLKHLIGLAPATWGSPQAHKGRTWLGAMVKGNRERGPDFMEAGDQVLDGLELGSRFTWDLAHADLLADQPFYDKGPDTPFVCVFIGNEPYKGLPSVANDRGTDGTVRWAGCALNTRKLVLDLTRAPIAGNGGASSRAVLQPWHGQRIDVPLIPVEGKNHGTIVSEPDETMVDEIVEFLGITDFTGYDEWLKRATSNSDKAWEKLLVDPGNGSGFFAGVMRALDLSLKDAGEMEGWQQFVIHARDERGDGVRDYFVDVQHPDPDEEGRWKSFEQMSTEVHAYGADPSYRCFHVKVQKGMRDGKIPVRFQIHASTGTALMAYQGYGSHDAGETVTEVKPVEIDLSSLTDGSLFYPFTTTLVEIILNREPCPLNEISKICKFTPKA